MIHFEACKSSTKSYPRFEIAAKVKCSYSSPPGAGFSAIEMTGNLLKQSFRTNLTIKYYTNITIHAKSKNKIYEIKDSLTNFFVFNLKEYNAKLK